MISLFEEEDAIVQERLRRKVQIELNAGKVLLLLVALEHLAQVPNIRHDVLIVIAMVRELLLEVPFKLNLVPDEGGWWATIGPALSYTQEAHHETPPH